MTSNLTEDCIQLIENNENDKLKAVLKDRFKYLNRCNILKSQNNDNIFDIAIKNNNFEAFNILLDYGYLYQDCDSLLNSLEIFKPKQLKLLLERGFKISKNFINQIIKKQNILGKQETILLLDLIFRYINFDTNFILNFLSTYYYNRNPLSQQELKTIIDQENKKINTMLTNDGIFEKYFNFNSDNPMGMACDKGCEFLLKYFIDHGADPNTRYYNHYTNDCYDINEYYEKNGEFLLGYGWNEEFYVDKVEIKTPLIYAINNENESLLKYLLEFGVDPNKTFYEMNKRTGGYDNECAYLYSQTEVRKIKTPLGIACEKENESMVRDLVEHGADIDARCEKYEFTHGCSQSDGSEWYYHFYMEVRSPLIIACEKENVSLVKYLVEHGADVDKRCFIGPIEGIQIKTPLCIACEKGNESLVKYLVEHGADIHATIYEENIVEKNINEEDNYWKDSDEKDSDEEDSDWKNWDWIDIEINKKGFFSKIDFIYNSLCDKMSECFLNNSIRNDERIETDGYNSSHTYSEYIKNYISKCKNEYQKITNKYDKKSESHINNLIKKHDKNSLRNKYAKKHLSNYFINEGAKEFLNYCLIKKGAKESLINYLIKKGAKESIINYLIEKGAKV